MTNYDDPRLQRPYGATPVSRSIMGSTFNLLEEGVDIAPFIFACTEAMESHIADGNDAATSPATAPGVAAALVEIFRHDTLGGGWD